MVPHFTIITLYVVGALELMLPLLILFFLRRRHTFAFSSIICGLAAYFVVNYVVINNVYTIIRLIAGDESFFLKQVALGLFLEALLAALVLPPLAWLITKTLRRGKWTLYDTIAMAVGYWALPMILDSAMQVSSASILQHANKGTLDTLATQEYPVELLNALVESVSEQGPYMLCLERVLAVITQFIVFLCILSVLLLVFYGVKRSRKVCLWLSMIIYFLVICIINGTHHYLGYWVSLVITLLLGAAAGYFIYRFLKYYRMQQIELIRKRKQFKEDQHEKYLKELEEKQKGRS